MSYTEEDVIREKAELATCQHYTEDYEYEEIDWPCGEVHGTCLECEAEIVRDVMYWPWDPEFTSDWRLAE